MKMSGAAAGIQDFKEDKDMDRKEYLVCIDSDGCLLDNMELKHKECFCPAFVNIWNLQPVSRYARTVWEKVNLYSRSRGTNRFHAVVEALDLVYDLPEVKAYGLEKPDLAALKKWKAETPELSARALREYAEQNPNLPGTLRQAADWSVEVDANVKRIVRGIKPFVNVEEALKKLNEFADVVVVSATPTEALKRELEACGVLGYFKRVFGQDEGTKSVCIAKMLEEGYDRDKALKVGDAPGDYKAAEENGILYYPIIPGSEIESWALLRDKFADIFKAGVYKGEEMDKRLELFLSALPEL